MRQVSRILLEENRPDPGQFGERSEWNRRKHRQAGRGAGREELSIQVARQADREDVHHSPADDLIDAKRDRQDRVQQRHQSATGNRRHVTSRQGFAGLMMDDSQRID